MRTTPRPETIREAPEIHLVDSVEHLHDGPLNDLVLQRGNTQRPQPPVRLRDVHPPTRLRPVPPRLHPSMQILKVNLQVLPVPGPRHPVHPRRRLRADRPIRGPEPTLADMVQQRREPRSLVPSCYLTHTAQRTGRVNSGTESGTRFAARVPLGSPPSLPHIRHRFHGLVRQVRRYYGAIRLPTFVHPRITASALPGRPAQRSTGRAIVGSPGSRAWRFRTCHGSQTAQGPPTPRDNAAGGVAFRPLNNVGTPNSGFRGSIARPARAPVNASPRPHGTSTHDSGSLWVANPSTQSSFHSSSKPVYPGAFSKPPRGVPWRAPATAPSRHPPHNNRERLLTTESADRHLASPHHR